MVITDVSVECYQRPLERPIRNGKYTYATSDACIVRITTDEGATGIGLGDESVGLSGAPRMIQATVESLRPATGRGPARVRTDLGVDVVPRS